ncbi:hypothetical protein MNB_ARC-1_1136 [hydrothermal vent metagenome]|uniref:Type II secretion system protein GspF domain-containing protein n=1 Tax=hydrothermal vent metagenome TaxID=652676 RepID=A0A3B1E7M8_9ZZZZ
MAGGFFDLNALSTKEKELVLLTVRGYSRLGIGLPEAFGILSRIEKNKRFLKVYKKVSNRIHIGGVEPSLALVEVKLLNTFEAFLLKNSLSTPEALDNINYIRKNKSRYEFYLVKTFLSSSIWFFTTLLSLPYLSNMMLNVESYIVTMLKRQQGINATGELEMAFWVGHPALSLVVYSIFFTFILSILVYIYYNKYYPYKLYPIFKGKAYSDAAIFFNILKVLKSTGKDTKDILAILIRSGEFKKDNPMLTQLYNASKMSSVFFKFNYPIDVVYFVDMGEKIKTIWDTMDDIITFCKNAGDVSVEKLEWYWKKPSYSLAVSFAIFTAVNILLFAFSALELYLTTSV